MVSDIQRVILTGRLTADPVISFTQGGDACAKFSLASSRAYKVNGEDKEKVSFFPCVAWNKLGEVMGDICKKGSLVFIEARLDQRSWTDKSGSKRSTVECIVEHFRIGAHARTKGNQPGSTPDLTDESPIPASLLETQGPPPEGGDLPWES
jgi:single-strand DNA-binding protein